jgi:hypothetical protein
MSVAADVFSIRYVGAFGKDSPDGVVPFDDLLSANASDPSPPVDRGGPTDAAAHVAAVTFDIGDGGLVPVARNHAELLAGGQAIVRESALADDGGILSTLAPVSFAGICLTLLPWLLTGGTLSLHHPFDPDVLQRQRRQDRCGTVVLPGPLACGLAETGAFAPDSAANVLAAWQSPERIAASSIWRQPNAVLTDIAIFGEAALVPGRRGDSSRPAPIVSHEATVALTRTEGGTVALRGPMVPHHVFPPGIERSGLPYFKIGPNGWVDTGYSCRIDSVTGAIVVTAPPAGLVTVGGYRFPLRGLQDVIGRIDGAATLAALPDPIVGQRLIGNAADRVTMQAALNAVGINPLVVAAFRDRTERDFASAGAG